MTNQSFQRPFWPSQNFCTRKIPGQLFFLTFYDGVDESVELCSEREQRNWQTNREDDVYLVIRHFKLVFQTAFSSSFFFSLWSELVNRKISSDFRSNARISAPRRAQHAYFHKTRKKQFYFKTEGFKINKKINKSCKEWRLKTGMIFKSSSRL